MWSLPPRPPRQANHARRVAVPVSGRRLAGLNVEVPAAFWQDLTPYGASDEVSSWRNYQTRNAALGRDSIAQKIGPKLFLSAGARLHWVGASWNDKASSVLP
jgi:hypothetical protein